MIPSAVHSPKPSDALNAIFPDYDLRTSTGYYKAVVKGVSGGNLKSVIDIISDRDMMAHIIGKDKSNLSKSYRVKALPPVIGDSVLDTVRVYMMASDIYGSIEHASEWLNTPIPALGGEVPSELMTTPAGRELVRQTLRKIEYGEYS
jgi:putative toxin-antitoxin system antitoxin component (TIGR02293 family)